eukprot:scaffold349174_cov30-Prasinocladus_malaysianus.AAC.1
MPAAANQENVNRLSQPQAPKELTQFKCLTQNIRQPSNAFLRVPGERTRELASADTCLTSDMPGSAFSRCSTHEDAIRGPMSGKGKQNNKIFKSHHEHCPLLHELLDVECIVYTLVTECLRVDNL